MIKNYFKIGWRNLTKNKFSSFINVGGLALGMAVALLISFWVYDELSFNKSHKNYARIVQVMQKYINKTGEIGVSTAVPLPLEAELRNKYGSDFKRIVVSFYDGEQILSYGEKKIFQTGKFMQPDGPDMLSLEMLAGNRKGLQDPSSILLSESAAKAIFGNDDPLNKVMEINSKMSVKVTGVYKDIADNSEFGKVKFIAPWDLLVSNTGWMKFAKTEWDNTSFFIYAELQPTSNLESVSQKIKNANPNHAASEDKNSRTEVFINPMSKWHLYNEWKNGFNDGGRIQFVRLFGIIGAFVLLLACINFMNLYTARSEKKAREVGIRKTIGSLRSQLIKQFLSESFMVVLCAFIVAIGIVALSLPWFNTLADKQMFIPWINLYFWLGNISFIIITTLLAGSYPAFYLSSFRPIAVLKGTFQPGRMASVPRKVLVVLQYSVSVTLIIGTIIVYRQIQYAKDRPVGYNRSGLLMIPVKTPDASKKLEVLQAELKQSGVVDEVAQSSSPVTAVYATGGGFTWDGMDPDQKAVFGKVWVSTDFGKTVGWQFTHGRDFSKEFATDSIATDKDPNVVYSVVINQAAAKHMNMAKPVGEIIKWSGQPLRIIGVIKDMVMESPYEPVRPSIYLSNTSIARDWITVRIKPGMSIGDAVQKIESVFKSNITSMPFDYKFADTEYDLKFRAEERVGQLSSVFSVLAIFISCLGLFGIASFMVSKRTKEIGVRKVLGASVFNVWGLLSRDFVVLVFISLFIAMPIAWYFMHSWLQNYQYRTEISVWVFILVGTGAMLITLLTVSFQAIKAAIANPVKSLRAE